MSRCGIAAGEHGTYVLTTNDLSGGTIDLVEKSGFLIEIESGSLKLTGTNPNLDTWNTVLTLEKQSATKGEEADDMMDPGSLQWAGEIAASVYVAVPRVHGNLRLFGAMTLTFQMMEDGPEIQSITAELEVSYPMPRGDLPSWLSAKLEEHDACGALEVGPGTNFLKCPSTHLRTLVYSVKCRPPDILNPFSAGPYDASKEDNNSTDVEPLLNVIGSLTLTYPCKEDLMTGGAFSAQPDCSLIVYQCTHTHSQHPPPWPYTRSLFSFQLPAVTAVVLSLKITRVFPA